MAARINIEDQFWDDVAEVAVKMGDYDKAVGQALRFIKFGQTKFRQNETITYQEFSEKFSDALLPQFAKREGDVIVVRGQAKHFGWLDNKRKAGKAGGSKPKQKKARSSKSKQTEASPSISISLSESNSGSKIMATTEVAPVANASKVYFDSYKKKYGHYPELGPKQHGILKRFSDSHPNRWRELIEGFLEMPDSWAVQRSHPVELLESKINEIVRYLATGKVVTKKVIEHAEEIIDKAQGTNRRPRKSIEEIERERTQMWAEANARLAITGGK